MAIVALGGDLGILSSRAGEFGESNLFPDNSVAKTSELAEILKGEHAKFQANVYDFLDYAAAAEKGTNLHRGESQSRARMLIFICIRPTNTYMKGLILFSCETLIAC
ncbi:unnamed protein product [Ectocarpus sp. 13 AM-2016]